MRLKQLLICLMTLFLLCGCAQQSVTESSDTSETKDISADKSQVKYKHHYDFALLTGMEKINNPPLANHYDLIIVDASKLSKSAISTLHLYADQVYGYVNAGTIKKSDKSYKTYKSLKKGKYGPNEYKVKISKKWRRHVYKQAQSQINKGVDGLLLDRFDVYSGKTANFNSLFKIIKTLSKKDKPLIIMNGHQFITDYLLNGKLTRKVTIDNGADQMEVKEIPYINGLLEENVFTVTDRRTEKTKKQNKTISSEIKDVFEKCQSKDIECYVVDYTKNNDWKAVIKAYCRSHDIHYYIAPFDLDAK